MRKALRLILVAALMVSAPGVWARGGGGPGASGGMGAGAGSGQASGIGKAAASAAPQAPTGRVTNTTATSHLPSNVPTQMPVTGQSTVGTKGEPALPAGVGQGGTTPSGVS